MGGCAMDVTPRHPTMSTWCPPPAGENRGGQHPIPTVLRCRNLRQLLFRERTHKPCGTSRATHLRLWAAAVPRLTRPRRPGQPARIVQPLEIPPAIPGSEAPPLRLPPVHPGETLDEQRSAIQSLFAELRIIPPAAEPVPQPDQAPLTLAQLQAMAVAHNPLIRQAASDVEAARGNMIQAGAYPNPHVGYQADDIDTGNTAGYQGGNISQTIVTGGKLKLARASATVDLQNAELALRRARYDLATQVRSNYLGVLVARERIKVNNALTQFADRVYRLQVKRVAAGQAAAYEPLQLRVLAVQAETQLIQSNHEYEAAWRKLAVTLNCPGHAPHGPGRTHRRSGAADHLRSGPRADPAKTHRSGHRAERRRAGTVPTPPGAAHARLSQHRHHHRHRARLYHAALHHGPQPAGRRSAAHLRQQPGQHHRRRSGAGPGRQRIRAGPQRLVHQPGRHLRPLRDQPANGRTYRNSILVDQVRAYRGQYQRYEVDPDADFNDVVTSQQTLASTISTYIQLLGDQWQAVADLAGLLQIDDIFALGQR